MTEPRAGATQLEFVDGVHVGIEERWAVITLSNPGRRNAFYPEMRQRLTEAVNALAGDPQIRAIILTGHDGHFCSGADLKRAGSIDRSPAAARERFRSLHDPIDAIVSAPQPVIVAVEGDAAGAGLSLACAADFIVAARGARLAASFAKVGLFPDMGILHSLERRVGLGAARRMLMLVEPVSAEAGLNMGLVDFVAETGEALAMARETADRLARLAPLSLASIKSALASPPESLDGAKALEMDVGPVLLASEDHQAALQAFLSKTTPNFRGS